MAESSLKNFVIIRHGQYQHNPEQLTEKGIATITSKIPVINQLINKESCVPVFASNQLRAIETGLIIARGLDDFLWMEASPMFVDENWKDLTDFINNFDRAHSLVICAHFEQVLQFPPYYCYKTFGFDIPRVRDEEVGYGYGVFIDREAKTFQAF